MKVCLAVAMTLALLTGSAAGAARWETYERLSDATAARVTVKGRERIYFRLTSQTSLVVPVDGPARLRVLTRVELPSGSSDVARYRVRATEGVHVFGELVSESSAATEALLVGGSAAVGKSRRLTFDIPAGKHRIELALSGAPAALVRIQRTTAPMAARAQ